MNLNSITGYAEAVARETLARNAAFLPVLENLCGVPVAPLTLNHLSALNAIGSPFLCGGKIKRADALRFMCLLCPKSGKPGSLRRWFFNRRCARLWLVKGTPPKFPLAEAIEEFIDDAWADAPGGGGAGRAYYALTAAMVGVIARHYHWSETEILALPVKRLWQYRTEILCAKGEPVLFNRSDRVLQQWLDRKN